MRNSIPPSRIAALAIVALTLAAVAGLVGTDENDGALSNAAQVLAEKAAQSSGNVRPQPPAAAAAPVTQPAPAAPAPIVAGGFAEEESLIDEASGFNPTPDADDPAQGEVVAIIEEEAPETSDTPIVIEEP